MIFFFFHKESATRFATANKMYHRHMEPAQLLICVLFCSGGGGRGGGGWRQHTFFLRNIKNYIYVNVSDNEKVFKPFVDFNNTCIVSSPPPPPPGPFHKLSCKFGVIGCVCVFFFFWGGALPTVSSMPLVAYYFNVWLIISFFKSYTVKSLALFFFYS